MTGDSGNPLLIADYGKSQKLQKGRPDKDIITGITSLVDSCAEDVCGSATAYIALPQFLPWIEDVISGTVMEPPTEVV